MEDRLIKMMRILYEPHRLPTHEVYHYTTACATRKILGEDGVSIKMTHVNDFEDILEGKTFEVFYDLALERLKNNGVIDDVLYNQLCEIVFPQSYLFYFNKNGSHNHTDCIRTECDVYIACFSIDGASDYMVERYIRNEEKQGCIIGFYTSNLYENNTTFCFGQGHSFELMEVFYGEQVIERIENILKEILGIYNGNKDFNEIKSFISIKLSRTRFVSKLARYSNEKEVRLILYIPKGDKVPEYYVPKYKEENKDGKRHVFISLPKYVVSDVQKSKTLANEEYVSLVERFMENGYGIQHHE